MFSFLSHFRSTLNLPVFKIKKQVPGSVFVDFQVNRFRLNGYVAPEILCNKVLRTCLFATNRFWFSSKNCNQHSLENEKNQAGEQFRAGILFVLTLKPVPAGVVMQGTTKELFVTS